MTRKQYEEARALIDQADELYGDLPDGAYWAACEEFGADMYLQIEVDEYEMAHNLGVHNHGKPSKN
jgi:hypothetical protein